MPDIRPRIPEIIDNANLMWGKKKVASLSIAVIAWTFWIYLFAPLLTIAGWIFGFDRFSAYVWQDPHGTWFTLAVFLALILMFSTAFILWAIYNKLRFGKLSRRRMIDSVTNEEMAAFFSLGAEEIQTAQSAKILEVYYEENGDIMKVIAIY
jgi:poly-beta-1,6-N-acetyl-D-glucosamine biosynthesis protein PgaD